MNFFTAVECPLWWYCTMVTHVDRPWNEHVKQVCLSVQEAYVLYRCEVPFLCNMKECSFFGFIVIERPKLIYYWPSKTAIIFCT